MTFEVIIFLIFMFYKIFPKFQEKFENRLIIEY